jgi:hypothetical protein
MKKILLTTIGLALSALTTSSYATIGTSTTAEIEAQYGKSFSNETAGGGYFHSGVPVAVAYDANGVAQALAYYRFGTTYFTAAEANAFDAENLPPGNLNWQKLPQEFIGPLPAIVTDMTAWVSQTNNGVLFVIDARYNLHGVNFTARIYTTGAGLQLLDKLNQVGFANAPKTHV